MSAAALDLALGGKWPLEHPQAVCDDCIAERLQISIRQHANHKTRELAGSGGFERRKGQCTLCGSEKLVIRRV